MTNSTLLSTIADRTYLYCTDGNEYILYFNSPTNTHIYNQIFSSYEEMIRFYLFATSQTAILNMVDAMPKSLPFNLRYDKAFRLTILKAQMKEGLVGFEYSKKNGETRQAIGTLIPSYLPKPKGTGRPTPKHLFKYYDIEKSGYRSFISSNLI